MKKFLVLVALSSFFSSYCFAQTVNYKLCYNSKTKALFSSTVCPTGTTQLTGGNIKKNLGLASADASTTPSPITSKGGLNYSKCYKQAGSDSGSASNGRVGVAVSCKEKSHVLVASGFTTEDNSQSFPSLSSQTIIFAGTIPNGVQVETTGKQNLFYKLTATITCCPQ